MLGAPASRTMATWSAKEPLCNAAMVKLTGYEKSEICGRNCRFMQGAQTEASAVREMVVAIRTGKRTTVRVTNYKKDGATFTNCVTLSPVRDDTGLYRFCFGVLSDAENELSDGAALKALHDALPRTMQASSQPPAFDTSLTKVGTDAQARQYRAAMVTFTRLGWSMSWEKALIDVASNEDGLIEYGKFSRMRWNGIRTECPFTPYILRTRAIPSDPERSRAIPSGPEWSGARPSRGGIS